MGQHSKLVSIFASAPSSQRFDSQKIVNIAEVNQRHSLEEREQRLKNVDQSYLVLVSGRLVLQKGALVRKQ